MVLEVEGVRLGNAVADIWDGFVVDDNVEAPDELPFLGPLRAVGAGNGVCGDGYPERALPIAHVGKLIRAWRLP
jgi:hypothetical protein